MVQNIVPAALLQRALRIFFASLFGAVVWVFVSAAASFAADTSPLVSGTAGAGTVGAVTGTTVKDVVDSAVAPAAALAETPPRTLETAAQNLAAATTPTATSAVRSISKPAAAVVESVVRDTAAVVKPILNEVPLPAVVVDVVVPQLAAPAPAANSSTPAETAPPAVQNPTPAAYSPPGTERAGQPFDAPVFRAAGTPPEATLQSPAGQPGGGPLPATPPAGAAGGANSAGSSPQTPAAGTTDAFSMPYNPAGEPKTRASAPDPNALNRNPGFSPD